MGVLDMVTGLRMRNMALKGDAQGAMRLAAKRGLMPHVEIDASDADFQPVQGVDLDEYARICASVNASQRKHSFDQATLDRILAEHGHQPGDWTAIANVWNERVMRNPAIKGRYVETFLSQDT